MSDLATIRKNVVKKYGGRCICCGEVHPEFLFVQATEAAVKEFPYTSVLVSEDMILRRLEFQKYPNGWQVICYNCRRAQEFGVCPHQRREPGWDDRPKEQLTIDDAIEEAVDG